ncbi:MAG: hypothetical protein JXX14_16405 [Deltaproteobacteria bacterium]|nr:hypothetical protein [Deltaproteobacteria bacterium]
MNWHRFIWHSFVCVCILSGCNKKSNVAVDTDSAVDTGSSGNINETEDTVTSATSDSSHETATAQSDATSDSNNDDTASVDEDTSGKADTAKEDDTGEHYTTDPWVIVDTETEEWLIIDTVVFDTDTDAEDDTTPTDPVDTESDQYDLPLSHRYVQQGAARVFDAGYSDGSLLVDATSTGNIVVSGYTANPLELDSDFNLDTDNPDYTLPFILELSPSGEALHKWTFPNGVYPNAAFVTDDKKVIWAGPAYTDNQFGTLTTAGLDNGYYVARFDLASGEPELLFSVETDDYAKVYAVTSDGAGDIYVAGWTGDQDWMPFSAKYDLFGQQQWESVFPGSSSASWFTDVEFIADSHLIAGVGAFDSRIIIGDETYNVDYRGDATTNQDGFIVWQDDATGEPTNSLQIGSTDFNTVQAIDITANGAYRLAGNMRGSMEFDGESISGSDDLSTVLMEIDESGALHWFHVIEGNTRVRASGIDSANRSHIVGQIDGHAKSFIAAIDENGNPIAMSVFATKGGNGGASVAFDGEGGIWMTGEFTDGTMVTPSREWIERDYRSSGFYLIRFVLEKNGSD